MTPEVRDIVQTSDGRILELSEGTGIKGERIFGVTEFEADDDGVLNTTRRGQMHRSIQSARKHFNVLKALK